MFCKLPALLEYLDLLQNIYIKNCALFLHTKFAISYYIFILYFYYIFILFHTIFLTIIQAKMCTLSTKTPTKICMSTVPHTEIFQVAFYLCILEMICPK